MSDMVYIMSGMV